MTRLSFNKYLLALGVSALALLVNGTANAQWTTGGPSPQGGTIFTGSGTTGPLSDTTSPGLTVAGGDQITLNVGGFAEGALVDTIVIIGQNTLLTNHGTIQGGDSGFYGVDLANSNLTLVNYGSILGGNGDPDTGSRGGDGGFAITATNLVTDLNAISITNNGGLIQAGNGGVGFGNGGGTGGSAIFLETNNSVTNFTLTNSGNILGGTGGSDATGIAGDGGEALLAFAFDSFTNIVVNNTGTIQGGSGGADNNDIDFGASGGAGLDLVAESGGVSGFALTNKGSIFGGTGGDNTSGFISGFGGVGGDGLFVFAETSISNFSVTNSGTISGGKGGDASDGGGNGAGGNAIHLLAQESDITGFSLNNSGVIIGGAGSDGGNQNGTGGNGIFLDAKQGSVGNISLVNSGVLAGGNGGSSTVVDAYGYNGGGSAVNIEVDNGGLNGLTLNNSGSILGGAGGSTFGEWGTPGGYGFYLTVNTSVTNLALNNSGFIMGGNGGDALGDFGFGNIHGYGGNAINVDASTADVIGFSLVNSGVIKGGNGGFSNNESGGGGEGLYLFAQQDITNVTLVNSGQVIGGNSGNASGPLATLADTTGSGLYVQASAGNLTNVSLNNSGSIIGGNGGSITQTAATGGEFGGNGGFGVFLSANNVLSHVLVNNSGSIIGGNAGSITGIFSSPNTFSAGAGGTGIFVLSDSINGLTINNLASGVIAGGNGGSTNISGGNGNAGAGGNGIGLFGGSNIGSGNIVVNNLGVIRGGNAGTGDNANSAGYGIYAATGGAIINNWGNISAGTAGIGVAVHFDDTNNTLNLNGHSEVHGTIEAAGSSNNVLNLNFTGVSPAAQAQIFARIVSQGNLDNWTGSFTVRGVTYTVDPMVIHLNMSSYQQFGRTPNQSAIGANLDSLAFNPAPGSSFANLLNAIDQSGGNASYALESLSPQPYQIYGDIAQATANLMTLSIDERLNNLRDGSESIDTTGIGGGSDATTTAGYDKDGKTVVVPDAKSLQKHWGFFAQGSGLFASVDAHGGDLSNAGFTSSGVIAGVDGKVNDHLVLGLLFNYDYTVADLDQVGSKANVQTLGGGIYAGYHNGDWYGNGLAAYGHNDYNSNRNIFFPGFGSSALGDTNGSQESVNIDGGYDFHLLNNKLTVGPIAGLQYVHLNVNSFNEAGAGAADLAVGGQDVDSLRSRFGFRADYKTQLGKEVAFATEFRAAWQHEFMDDNHAIDGAFIGSGLGGFAVETTKPQRDAALVGVGINFTVRDRATLFFDYDVQAGQESYLEQSVKGGFKLSF